MGTGTTPSQGDIVLIPIPFTDRSSQKRRPVIAILNDWYNQTVSRESTVDRRLRD